MFDFVLFLLLTICGSVSLWLFYEISKLVNLNENQQTIINLAYFSLSAFFAYTWWHFDFIPVMLMLWVIYLILHDKIKTSAVVLAAGILAKWFPILLLPAIFRYKKWKQAFRIALISFGITCLIWGGFYLISPVMTKASLESQPSRSSWQTIWALIDSNYTTGEFIPLKGKTLA
ncbi:MAG: hypothetical protein CL609_12805 [Anaerolineaceae bacterium]|nr:hypothetical protein [Anaerolineaceae bacterium]